MRRLAVLLAALALWPWPPARAEDGFPSRPIRVVVPFATGGPSDIVARIITPRMSQLLGQTVVVEARPGAGGVTGVDVAAKAAPDGYTIALGSAGGLAISPGLDRAMPYDVARDLAPLTLVVVVPEPVVVPAAQPFTTLAQLIAAAKAAPGRLNYGSTGPGGMPHLAGELLKSVTGMDLTHVPYRGGAPLATALLANEVQVGLADLPALLPHIQAGALRPLAIGHPTRVPWLPEVPTFAELGLPQVVSDNWHGLVAPARTPPAVLALLHRAAIAALEDPEVKRTLHAQGALPAAQTPEQFADFIRTETTRWAGVIRAAHITAE